MKTASNSSTNLSPAKRIAFAVVLGCVATVISLIFAEIVLRIAPIPGIEYHTFYYDEVTGGHFYPNTKNVYRSARGESVTRHINSWGFMDNDRSLEPEPGTTRIGFFGDSWTEARQVPVEESFVYLVEEQLNARPGPRVETISFGVTGRSTLQSYLEAMRWMGPADLEYVVYVFSENDPGDQIREIKQSDAIPYALLESDSFVVDNEFRDLYAYKTSGVHRSLQWWKARSLVLSTVDNRVKLLKRYGIKMRPTEADMKMEAEHGGITTAPSTWPDSLKSYGGELFRRIVLTWNLAVIADGRVFIVMIIPRESQLNVPVEEQDSWARELARYCDDYGIPCIDLTTALNEAVEAGGNIFYDHFTAEGHRVVADAFVSGLTEE